MLFEKLLQQANENTGARKVAAVVSVWEFVALENQNQKELVSSNEWNTWEKFKKETESKMLDDLDKIAETGEVTPEQYKRFDSLLSTITSAKRSHADELIKRNTANIEKETTKKTAKDLIKRLRLR